MNLSSLLDISDETGTGSRILKRHLPTSRIPDSNFLPSISKLIRQVKELLFAVVINTPTNVRLTSSDHLATKQYVYKGQRAFTPTTRCWDTAK